MADETLNGGAQAPEGNDSTGNITPEVQGIEGTNQTQQVEAAGTPPPEKMLSQSEVNGIVQKRMNEVKEKTRREVLNEMSMQPNSDAYSTPPPVQTPSQSNYGDNQQYSDHNDPRQIVRQELASYQNQLREEANHRYLGQIANQFTAKINDPTVKERYPDYDEQIATLDFSNPKTAILAPLTNGYDNAPDMVYELAKNRTKLSAIRNLHFDGDVLGVQRELKKLSQSIRTNQQAAAQPKPSEPLSQVTPSNVGRDDGAMGVNDLRGQDWLRA